MRLLSIMMYLIMSSLINTSKICSHHRQRIKHRFHALRHCQRSNRTVIGLINVETARECAEYARKRFGMAFNFGPKGRNLANLFDVRKSRQPVNATGRVSPKPPKGRDTITSDPEEFYNCQVMDCPEYQNLSSIVNDTRFDYYSLYTRPPPSVNATCLPSIGMFVLDDRKLNYTLAYNECLAMGGSLAHVASEGRTNSLSRLYATAGAEIRNTTNVTEAAYVGVNETMKGKFVTSGQEPLDCFLYRAWAPGHPSKNRQPGCVAISTNNSWTVHNCNRPLRFICELHTSGPPRYEVRLRRKCSTKQPNNRIAPGRKSN